MRAAPAVQVSLTHFGVWRAAVVALTLAAGSAVLAWLAAQEQLVGFWAGCAAIGAATLLLWIGVPLARVQSMELCWSGQGWSLRTLPPEPSEPVPGEVSVAIDLGAWMLLRFRPVTSSGWGRTRWLPVQRRGIEVQWHALRCAVYSPRRPTAADVSRSR